MRQLERYAEAKTGRASPRGSGTLSNDGFAAGAPFVSDARGGSRPKPFGNRADDAARTGATSATGATMTNRWGARKGTNGAASTRGAFTRRPSLATTESVVSDENRNVPNADRTYENSLVGGWDAGSSRWDASSVPDSDVRSVYSAPLEDSFGGAYALPDAPADAVARVDERAGAAAETLERHRAALERAVSRIASAARDSDEAASLETDGMFTAGKTKTGVGVIDFFARDPVGAGPKGSLARSVNERAERRRRDASVAREKHKWLSPAPSRRGATEAASPEEPPPIVRVLRSVFGCGCGGR